MDNTLRIYKDGEFIKEKSQNKESKTTITIDGLESNTTYEKGMFKLAWKGKEKESDKVDVPEFKTDKIGVESLTVSQDEKTLSEGDTHSIDVTVEPSNADDKTVSYSSNNDEVATVSNSGEVEAIKSGNATITVKSKDNSKATSKVKIKVETKDDEGEDS